LPRQAGGLGKPYTDPKVVAVVTVPVMMTGQIIVVQVIAVAITMVLAPVVRALISSRPHVNV